MNQRVAVDAGKELKSAVKTNLNVPGFMDAMMDKVALPALQEAVAKSENKIDDVVVAALGPLLATEVKKLIRVEWDKLFTNSGEPVL